MAEWAPKRFWKAAGVAPRDTGFGVTLDGRPLRTPAKHELLLPTRALAQAIADEWDAQVEVLVPATMPMTRMANSAIDRVAPRHAEVAAYVSGYGATDLLCYREAGQGELARRQAKGWDPVLDWTAGTFGARLRTTEGVMPVTQPPEALDRLHAAVAGLDPFALTALHDLVSLSGSLILGLAVERGRLAPDEAWTLSRIDEDWQIEQWGSDEEAEEAAGNRRAGFLEAFAFHAAARILI
jgi:chaperone required for assembly of F1-ATPase